MPSHHVLAEARPSALSKTRNRRHAACEYTHVTRLTYSAFDLKIWSIFHQSQIRKTAYASRASDGFPRVLLLSAQCATAGKRFCRPNSKIRSDLILESIQPMADVCARQPFQRAIRPCGRHRAKHIPPDEISANYTTFRQRPSNRAKGRQRKMLSQNTEKAETGRHGVLMKDTRLFLCARFAPSLRLKLENDGHLKAQ